MQILSPLLPCKALCKTRLLICPFGKFFKELLGVVLQLCLDLGGAGANSVIGELLCWGNWRIVWSVSWMPDAHWRRWSVKVLRGELVSFSPTCKWQLICFLKWLLLRQQNIQYRLEWRLVDILHRKSNESYPEKSLWVVYCKLSCKSDMTFQDSDQACVSQEYWTKQVQTVIELTSKLWTPITHLL